MNEDEKISIPFLITVGLMVMVSILLYYFIPMSSDTNSFEDTKSERQLTPLEIDHERRLPKKNISNSTVQKSVVKTNTKSYKAPPLDVDALSESNRQGGEQISQEKFDDKYYPDEEMAEVSSEAKASYENYEEKQREIAATEEQYQNDNGLLIEQNTIESEAEAADLERASRNRPEDFSQKIDSDHEAEYQNELDERWNATEDD